MSEISLFEQVIDKLQDARPVQGGKYYQAKCPFHLEVLGHEDENPSLLVYPTWFKCKGCEAEGPLKKLWDKIQGVDTCLLIAKGKRLTFPWYKWPDLNVLAYEAHQRLLTRPELETYLVQRGIESRIEPCQLGYVEGFYIFPCFDQNHKTIGIIAGAGPALRKKFNDKGKYIVSPDFAGWLVPDWSLVERSDRIFIAYGVLDNYTLSDLRIPCGYWLTGKSSRPEQIQYWNSTKRWVYHIPDKGEELDAKLNANVGGYQHKVILLNYPNGIKDPNGFACNKKKEALQSQLAKYL